MRITRWPALVLAGAGLFLMCRTGRCGTMGAEWANWDTNGDPFLPNTGSNASDFYFTMSAFGHAGKFLSGNGNFWKGDTVDPNVTGSWDQSYADNANVYFFSTHGGSNANAFVMSAGFDNVVDGDAGHLSWTNSGGHQWWILGNKDLRILGMVSCHSLQLTDIPHWDPVAAGLHLITGGDGLMYDNAGRGRAWALFGNFPGISVKQAWFIASPDSRERPVVLAYGVNSSDALNRLNNERFSSSMVRLGPRTYRWWSWMR